MATNLYPPPRPLSVGETIDLAFRIFRATLLTCLLFAGLAVIASEMATLYKLATHHALVSLGRERDPVFWLLYLIGWLLAIVLYSAMLLRQYAVLNSPTPAVGTEVGTVVRRLPGLVLLWVLLAVASLVWFIPVLAFRNSDILTVMLVVVVLSIPATWVAVTLSVSWPVFLLTGRDAVSSLAQSRRLVSGSWWRLAVIYTVALVLLFILYTIAGVIAVMVAVPLAGGDVAVAATLASVVAVILAAIVAPFMTALVLAVYGDLSVRREGADLAQRISAAG
jgi:hypothetical protein